MSHNCEYNKVYELLVTGDKDFVGMLAYSIYKKQKQEYIVDFIKNKGVRPTVEDLKEFHKFATQKTQLKMYKDRATVLTQDLTSLLLSQKIENVLSNLKNGFWRGVGQNLFANFIWLLILALVAFILWSHDHAPLDALKEMIDNNNS